MVHRGLIRSLPELFFWALGRRERYRVTGASMRPALPDGALVLVDRRLLSRMNTDDVTTLLDAGRTSPVVVLNAGLREQTEAMQHTVAACLAKPFDLDELLAVVARLCPTAPSLIAADPVLV